MQHTQLPPKIPALDIANRFRGDRRAIAFFAALIMVGVFLMFYFTTTRLEQSIKEAR